MSAKQIKNALEAIKKTHGESAVATVLVDVDDGPQWVKGDGHYARHAEFDARLKEIETKHGVIYPPADQARRPRVDSLTDYERSQLTPWSKRWIDLAMSTAPIAADHDEIRHCITELYKAAGLVPPPPERIVFVASPLAGVYAAAVGAWAWGRKDRKGDIPAPVLTGRPEFDGVMAAGCAAAGPALAGVTIAAPLYRTLTMADEFAGKRKPGSKAVALDFDWVVDGQGVRAAVAVGGQEALEMARNCWSMNDGGNQRAGTPCQISFFRHIAKLDIDYNAWQWYERLAEISGPRWMHEQFCVVSDRPEVLTVDNASPPRPHADDGPFCKWRDGTALYCVHGVRVPAWVIESPDLLNVARIDGERNAEVRRVMLDRFGIDRYMRESGAKVLDECPADHPMKGLRTARLLRRDVEGDEAITVVDLLNSTPEPDGTVKRYMIRVPPTINKAVDGLAWGFGVTAQEYLQIAAES